MEKRLPLPFLLDEDSDSPHGRRHRIPHRTFRATTDNDRAFFDYLDSNDTRLPQHAELNGRACAATEYDSYTGEEIWTRDSGLHTRSESEEAGVMQTSHPVAPVTPHYASTRW